MDADTERTEWVAGLRELADFVESHPTMPLPTVGAVLYAWGDSGDAKAELARFARMLAPVDKSVDDYFFKLTKAFGPHDLSVLAQRTKVCQRVVVGTRTEPRLVPPPGVEMVEVTETVDIIEWVCPPSILAEASDEANEPAVA